MSFSWKYRTTDGSRREVNFQGKITRCSRDMDGMFPVECHTATVLLLGFMMQAEINRRCMILCQFVRQSQCNDINLLAMERNKKFTHVCINLSTRPSISCYYRPYITCEQGRCLRQAHSKVPRTIDIAKIPISQFGIFCSRPYEPASMTTVKMFGIADAFTSLLKNEQTENIPKQSKAWEPSG